MRHRNRGRRRDKQSLFNHSCEIERALRYGSRGRVLSGREMDRCCGEPRRDRDPHMDKLLTPAKSRLRTPPSGRVAPPTDKHRSVPTAPRPRPAPATESKACKELDTTENEWSEWSCRSAAAGSRSSYAMRLPPSNRHLIVRHSLFEPVYDSFYLITILFGYELFESARKSLKIGIKKWGVLRLRKVCRKRRVVG